MGNRNIILMKANVPLDGYTLAHELHHVLFIDFSPGYVRL